MNQLLLVDDEPNVLNALRRELASDEYGIETFDNPAAALQRCREVPFALVIADYKMPEMNGIEFLKQFGQLRPDAARLLLSGKADIDALVRTINETHIYRFLAKPWDKHELQSSVAQALVYHNILRERRRLADAYRDSHSAVEQRGHSNPYHIVLVDSDRHALELMSRGLAGEGEQGSMFGALQQKMAADAAGILHDCKLAVYTFTSAAEALEHAEHNACDLIAAAQTLPDMDGIQLLGKFRQIQPDAACILLSSAPDKTTLSQAINDIQVHSLLRLYWDTYELKANARRLLWNLHTLRTAVMQALAARELLLENRRLALLSLQQHDEPHPRKLT